MAALKEALTRFGRPDIFNSDQGAQFTSEAFTDVLKEHGVAISMDGEGRAMDNVFVERLWRTVKYEHLYLNPADDGTALKEGLARYFAWYNQQRPHSGLDDKTPDEVYFRLKIPRPLRACGFNSRLRHQPSFSDMSGGRAAGVAPRVAGLRDRTA